MKYKNVVWDWNGTLLNDVKVGVNTLNDMLGRRGLPLLSVEDYKEKFGFPVIDFYDRVGFDMEKESFHELSVDFVETYDKYAGEVGLNEGVREVLAGIQQTGVKQYVLSALREDLLQQIPVLTALVGRMIFMRPARSNGDSKCYRLVRLYPKTP